MYILGISYVAKHNPEQIVLQYKIKRPTQNMRHTIYVQSSVT
jgi:hypothetical protein